MATGDEKEKEPISLSQQFSEAAKTGWKQMGEAIEGAYNTQVKLNEAFGQGQERLSEMWLSISDIAPRISRLGGGIIDVQNTMIGIAEASRRNVIANTEDVEKLYAAFKVTGIGAKELSDNFLDIGVGVEQIGKQLEGSVNYIRSIGGNTKQVMTDVNNNMKEMNRYQFEGGVVGLTKMAAQASMLRFDMSNTFILAEKVLDPEGAINMASAFQRLGVSAGNLVDPFQLMNQSINDPSGLQTSLAEVSKQFTYFDNETKTFKINPQGVLTLRQIEEEAGIARGSLSKMGLAAKELDQRLSAVGMAGLNIKEEDKQYLANIAKMGEGGEYEVKLTNEKGDIETKKLSDITQKELSGLVEAQKTGPKTLEEIALKQLSVDEAMLAGIKGLRDSFTFGVTSAKQIRQGAAGFQRVSKTVLGETSDAIKAKDFRDLSQGFLTSLGGIATDLKEGNKPLTDVLGTGLNRFGDILETSQKNFTEIFRGIGENISKNMTNQTVGEKMLKSGVSEAVKLSTGNTTSTTPITSSITNKVNILQNGGGNPIAQTTNSKVDVGGKIEIEVKAPSGVSGDQLKQMMDSTINSIAFKDYIVRTASPSNPTKEPVSKTYSA